MFVAAESARPHFRVDYREVACCGHYEQTTPAAPGFPYSTDRALLFGILRCVEVPTLVLDGKHPAVYKLTDEIWVEVVFGGLQSK
jgi:hypothetical protein